SHEIANPEVDLLAALPHCRHIHIKDVLSDSNGWRFVPIGQGSLDYRTIGSQIATNASDFAVGIELPLRLRRPGRSSPVRDTERLSLESMRASLQASLAAVTGFLHG